MTVSYDNAADRWVMSFLGGGAQLAISDGPDPVNDGWTVYTYGSVNDYQKVSVWHDGYYLTANKSGEVVYVLERDVILNGGEDPQIVGFSPPGLVFNPGTVKSLATSNMLGSDYPENSPGYIRAKKILKLYLIQ